MSRTNWLLLLVAALVSVLVIAVCSAIGTPAADYGRILGGLALIGCIWWAAWVGTGQDKI